MERKLERRSVRSSTQGGFNHHHIHSIIIIMKVPIMVEIILNNDRQLERVERIVKESVAAGAKVEVWQLTMSIVH